LSFTKLTTIARKLPSPLYKLAAQAWIDHEFPRHIFIETTANCNLSCEFCPREKRKEDMDFELFKEIINECSEYGPRSFSLHLFGEPLLYPHILEAISYIKKKNKKHTVLLTTNGTLLNRFADQLVDLKVDKIIWTWRRNNFTDHTKEIMWKHGLIRLLIEETPKEEFDTWSKYPNVEVKHLHNYGGQIDTTKWGLDNSNEMVATGSRYPCYHLWLAPAIRWNGDITICCNDPNGVESIGRYSDNFKLSDFWRSGSLEAIRSSHLNGQYKGLCAGCNSYKAYPDIFFSLQKKANHG
jgi:hypothetical protein